MKVSFVMDRFNVCMDRYEIDIPDDVYDPDDSLIEYIKENFEDAEFQDVVYEGGWEIDRGTIRIEENEEE